MCVSPTIKKITAWTSMHYFTKYICLTFLIFTVVAYPNQILAADTSSKQPKQIVNKETISGAFGIKFGEDIKPYLEGHYSNDSLYMQDSSFRFKYMRLNPPINLKEQFPNAHTVELSGISDDNNRVIVLKLRTLSQTLSRPCGQGVIVKPIMELLREKYKIIKAQENENGIEEYGDGEGNKIKTNCSGNSVDVTYTSHLLLDYIAHLKVEQQKQIDEIKKSLKKVM
jgi:hypothetical protein